MSGYYWAGSVLAALVFSVPGLASGGKPVRSAEVIRMGQPAAPHGQEPDYRPPEPGQSEFRLLDLAHHRGDESMREGFGTIMLGHALDATGPRDVGTGQVAIAPYSDIAVPGWMRAPLLSSLPMAGASFVPGCMAVPYRPSGFLPLHVEARRRTAYDAMSAAACEAGIPVGLFDALVLSESAYNVGAVSPKNAYGLAQLMPGTAAGLGIDRFDPVQNLRGGARYLRAQLDSFGQVPLALAAYNAGPGRVKRGRIPAIKETRNYVRDVLDKWTRLAGYHRIASVSAFAGLAPAPIVPPPVQSASIQVF